MSGQTLFLPVEIKKRELLGKALLATVAAEAGHTAYLGEQNELFDRLDRLPAGIYLEKVFTRAQARRLRRYADLGLYIAGWDEEGLLYRNAGVYLNDRIAPEAFGLLDQFFAWGNVQRSDVIDNFTGSMPPITATGNPRFDLLRPEFRGLFAGEAEALKARHGNYILVNTNFGRINHVEGFDYAVKLRQARGTVGTPESQARALRLDDYVRQNLDGLLAALPAIEAAFPDHTVIVRPHPSENIATWQDAAAGLVRTHVASQDNAIAWILGADAIVHNSCTTSVEAFMLDVPRVAYNPFSQPEFDVELANLISEVAHDPEELVAALKSVIAEGQAPLDDDATEIVERYISARDGALASENILAALVAVTPPHRGAGQAVVNRLSGLAIRASRPLRWALNPTAQSDTYSKQKFDHLTLSEMTGILDQFRAASGRFARVEVNPVAGSTTCYRFSQRAG
jgi:surface carbohydrate biosynthesis protein